MKKILSPKIMKKIDEETISSGSISGFELMQNAGVALYEFISFKFESNKHVLILCGLGNNGGDGFVLAKCLLESDFEVSVFITGPDRLLKGDAKKHYEILEHLNPDIIYTDSFILKQNFDIIVDAVYGIGFRGVFDSFHLELFKQINLKKAAKIAVDIPSGLNGQNGNAVENAFIANNTVTFGAGKYGLYLNEGPNYAGDIIIKDIGLDDKLIDKEKNVANYTDLEFIQNYFPNRNPTGYKHHFGKILIIGGSTGMSGSVILSAKAALRTGAGLVKVATGKKFADIVEAQCLESMTVPLSMSGDHLDSKTVYDELKLHIDWADVIVIGMGLSINKKYKSWIHQIINTGKKVVIDADALKIIDLFDKKTDFSQTIMTPHLGEYAALNHTSVSEIKQHLPLNVFELMKKVKASCLLKGKYTLITNGEAHHFNPTGNSGMATAGSGDVLSGILAALIGQGVHDLQKAGTIAAYIHGLAGDLAAKKLSPYSMIASDIIEHLTQAINDYVLYEK